MKFRRNKYNRQLIKELIEFRDKLQKLDKDKFYNKYTHIMANDLLNLAKKYNLQYELITKQF